MGAAIEPEEARYARGEEFTCRRRFSARKRVSPLARAFAARESRSTGAVPAGLVSTDCAAWAGDERLGVFV